MEDYKDIKRNKILDAAFKLFSDEGYENTKIADIAIEAGIGKGTVYEYFKSKDSLFVQVFQDKILSIYAEIASIVEKENTCEDKLKAAVLFELNNSNIFGNSKNIMPYVLGRSKNGSPIPHNNDFFSVMHQLMVKKFEIIHSIISQGISTGEFKAVNTTMATTTLIGALNFYLAFHYDTIPRSGNFHDKFHGTPASEKKEPWDIHQLLDIIMNGLKLKN